MHYLLSKLAPLVDTKNLGLYRDDGLAVIHKANGPKMDRIRKDINTLFKSEGLSITIDTNFIETDFIDVSFNLKMDKFFPYRKPNNTPLYIYSESNLPSPNNCNRRPADVFQICHAMKMNSTRLNLFTNQL